MVLLHTAESNVQTFSKLLADLAPEIPAKHILRDDLLAAAFAADGLTDKIRNETRDALIAATNEGAGLVVCTCSTIGPGADDAHSQNHAAGKVDVLRIDRPMAQEAVSSAENITVAATFSTTLKPTLDLVEDAARVAGREVNIVPCLIEGAKELFQAGDTAGYQAAIANGLQQAAQSTDLIVLAQASMAPALAMLDSPLPVPVLSSPESGIKVAIDAWRSAQAGQV
jgi:hypothetical protein